MLRGHDPGPGRAHPEPRHRVQRRVARRRPSPFIAEALDRPASVPAGAACRTWRDVPGAPPRRAAAGGRGHGGRRAPGPLTLSHSQVDDYLTCPLKYRLRHVVARAHASRITRWSLGNALHQAVAAWHLGQLRGRPLDEAGILDGVRRPLVERGVPVARPRGGAFRGGPGRAATVRGDRRRTPTRDTVAVERSFQVRLGADVVRGRYDRVDTTADGAIITDYKSSDVRDQGRADERARESLQLQVYALAWEAETGELPKQMELHFLDSGVVGRVAPDPKRLDRARRILAQAADGIRCR